MEDLAAQKASLRGQVRKAVAALPPARRALEEEVVTAAVQDAPEWRAARILLLYRSFGHELSTVGLANAAWRLGKRVAFPRLVGDCLELRLVAGWTGFSPPSPLGVSEPTPEAPLVQPADIDLAIVPGVAFEAGGRRLGRGGGHYDRLLPDLRLVWGLAFDCQVVPHVPHEPHDQALQRVVHAGSILP